MAFSYLMDLTVGMYGRVFQLFYIFYIFPLYFIIEYYLRNKKFKIAVAILLYIVFPFILKVTVLAKDEYLYQSILFN